MNLKVADCGTTSGYARHLRLKEEVCQSCRIAKNESVRLWKIANSEKVAQSYKKWAEQNPEKLRANRSKWAQENQEHYKNKKRARRAKIKNQGTEKYTVSDVIEAYGTSCHICNEKIDMEANRMSGQLGWQKGLQIDHLIAIANGGSDTLENVRPSHGWCNLKKGAN